MIAPRIAFLVATLVLMRRSLILATVLGGGLITACGDSTGPGSIFGTYTLVSINGEQLPVDLDGIEVSAGWVRLDSDSTYAASLTADFGSGPETETTTGNFAVEGSTIDFDEGLLTGTVSGNTLTLIDNWGTWVFRK
jgi:hypothetical protein